MQLRDPERYQILGEHGRGGLGRVFRAHDRELGRDVAIKELLSRGHIHEVRFLSEALITARLEHPGIVPLHEAGRWPDGTPFYAMKLVSGRPLRDLIAERNTVEQRIELLHHVIAVADAIAYAHGRNIIHRDLKPSNVIVGDFGETVVIDWGLAKDVSSADESTKDGRVARGSGNDGVTVTGSVLGTPAYMAPEQERGERVDQRADVYAIGAMLWELCSLKKVPPTDANQRHRILREGGIDQDLAAILDKALDLDPARRYPDAGALAADLKAFKAGARIAARRYSLWGMFIHRIRRHRAVALSATAMVVLVVTGVVIYVRNIAHERAQAVTARETAVTSNAAALLDHDPTRAWASLRSAPASAATTFLRARIRAAGIADRSVDLPATYDENEVTPRADRVLIATADRALSMLDPKSGSLTHLVDGLTEPEHWATTDDLVYFVHQRPHLAIATVGYAGGPAVDLVPLDEFPLDVEANKTGVFWLSSDGTLYHSAVDRPKHVLTLAVEHFLLLGSQIVICDQKGALRLGATGSLGKLVGLCTPGASWDATDDDFAYADTTGNVSVFQAGEFRTLAMAAYEHLSMVKITRTGLVAGIGSAGDGVVLHFGASTFEHVTLTSRPAIVAASEDLVAWALLDGSIKVLDTRAGREWTIQAHPQVPECLELLSNKQIMTCGSSDIRFWTLADAAPQLVVEIPAVSNNVAFNAEHDALLDNIDGHAYLIRQGEKRAITLHKHDGAGYGVAWCDGRACSAGRDGRVLCTDTATLTSYVAADLRSTTPWIAEGGGHCYTATASGGVFDLRAPVRPIYEHRNEPYRLAASRDGQFIASGDWGGDVMVYDAIHSRILAAVERLHVGVVTNVLWSNDELITAGADGELRISTPTLALLRHWQLRSRIPYVDSAGGTIGAGLDDGSLWVLGVDGTFEHRITTGTKFSSLSVCPSGAVVAAGTTDGDLFVVTKTARSAVARFEHGRISCLGFETDDVLIVCTASGRIVHLPLAALSFR